MSNFKEIVNNLNINIKFKPSEIKKFKKEIIFPLMILDFEAYRFLSTSPYYIKDDKCIHKPFLAGVLVIKNISFFSDKNKDNFKYEHFTSLRRSDDQYKPILKIFKRLNDKIERNKVKTIMCLDINMEKNIINFAKTKKFTSKTWNNIKYIDIFKIINNSSVFSFNDQEGNLINKNKAENIAKISEGFDKNLKKECNNNWNNFWRNLDTTYSLKDGDKILFNFMNKNLQCVIDKNKNDILKIYYILQVMFLNLL